ncbi:uncharacterized protein CELE_T26H5.11 [Caenorhabditis elegans]|uniref:Uncharacterized protein n=1 Tax=Caenorhabditis elegans TaxID=6239 RepID=E3W750_CAEEL|nr:Uncharacterized protein CELE_T26H5.11 [Caenorhabditis elegans]CBX53339.1 Uncharacterized protein CELE_T26H5.11 [Caenorhabditis elegans]|eukprot:NP_001256664.1 Uncharacterized protein CELE_T26H5.11 [Caenorhabditis elegans]
MGDTWTEDGGRRKLTSQ